MNRTSASQDSTPRILVVDDNEHARNCVIDVLQCAGYFVVGLASAVEAIARLERDLFDVVITDLQMPGVDGLELIRQLQKRRIPAECIMVTGHATIASAVEAMRFGAFDYLEKPFDVGQLERLVERALACRRVYAADGRSVRPLSSDAFAPSTSLAAGEQDDPFLGMVGNSLAMRQFRQRLLQVAPTDETVLICGESGTGKELAARAVHLASRRARGPLVSLNCPALSPQLAESELFGHCRGAFTGADADRAGRFQAAEGGTILLDEITEIDLPLQAKLLRVLQQRTFEPVGSSKTQSANVRVIASTNRDLQEEVAAGRFREDLYYRLAVVPLTLPPLRERGEDVQTLVDHFLARAGQRLGRSTISLAAEARTLLTGYRWPGNVRELENLVTRACVLATFDVIGVADLTSWLQDQRALGSTVDPIATESDDAGSADLSGAPLAELEKQAILATLDRFEGHRGKAAESLGIGVRTLSGKLRAYGYAPRARSFGVPTQTSAPFPSDRPSLPQGSAETAAGAVRRSA